MYIPIPTRTHLYPPNSHPPVPTRLCLSCSDIVLVTTFPKQTSFLPGMIIKSARVHPDYSSTLRRPWYSRGQKTSSHVCILFLHRSPNSSFISPPARIPRITPLTATCAPCILYPSCVFPPGVIYVDVLGCISSRIIKYFGGATS